MIISYTYACDYPACGKRTCGPTHEEFGWQLRDGGRHVCDEHKNVTSEELDLRINFNDYIQIVNGKLFFRYDTEGTAKDNWSLYCSISDQLKDCGFEIKDVQIEHDCISGFLEPIVSEEAKMVQDVQEALKKKSDKELLGSFKGLGKYSGQVASFLIPLFEAEFKLRGINDY